MKPLHAPDDPEKPFIARWNVLTRILLVDPSVKAVARSAMDFGDFKDGSSCHPGNGRMERETGLSDRTIRTAWQVLREIGMAERVAHSSSTLGLATEYQLMIPGNWRGLPIYGPHVRDFHCLHCEKQFTPQGNCTMHAQKRGGQLTYRVILMTFCPPPRKKGGRPEPDCFQEWQRARKSAGEPTWEQLDTGGAWALFRKARGDDW